jgi:hypothetical protein
MIAVEEDFPAGFSTPPSEVESNPVVLVELVEVVLVSDVEVARAPVEVARGPVEEEVVVVVESVTGGLQVTVKLQVAP